MTTFESILLFIYGVFAFSYMIKKYGIDEANNTLIGIMICMLALTIGLICCPAALAFDIYDKLNNKQNNDKETKIEYEDEC